MELTNFYQGKRVFITGVTGFKGSWLAQILLTLGAQVGGYALAPDTNPNLFTILSLDKNISYSEADVRDRTRLIEEVEKFNPDLILHLAAQPSVEKSYKKPIFTYETNIIGTVNILEAMRLLQIKSGVIVTTDKVYRNYSKGNSFKEDDPLGGYDPYSCSKACADLITNSYSLSFFNPKKYNREHQTLIATARSGNVVGGGQWSEGALVPDLVKAVFVDREKLTLKNPQVVRTWLHVMETLRGYLLLGKGLYKGNLKMTGAWNFGLGQQGEASVEEITRKFLRAFQMGDYDVKRNYQVHHDQVLKVDAGKAYSQLGWLPRLSLDETVKLTAHWYQAYYQKRGNASSLLNKQIADYFLSEK